MLARVPAAPRDAPASTIAIASECGLPLWCDDIALRQQARHCGVPAFSHLDQGRVHRSEQPEPAAVLGCARVGADVRVQPGQQPVVTAERLSGGGVGVEDGADGPDGGVPVQREVQVIDTGQEVFDAGEGGAELGDQVGQVGNEPAALLAIVPLLACGGVGDSVLDFLGQGRVPGSRLRTRAATGAAQRLRLAASLCSRSMSAMVNEALDEKLAAACRGDVGEQRSRARVPGQRRAVAVGSAGRRDPRT